MCSSVVWILKIMWHSKNKGFHFENYNKWSHEFIYDITFEWLMKWILYWRFSNITFISLNIQKFKNWSKYLIKNSSVWVKISPNIFYNCHFYMVTLFIKFSWVRKTQLTERFDRNSSGGIFNRKFKWVKYLLEI